MFLLFAGEQYSPGGGAWDYRGTFEMLDSAIAAGEARRPDWYHVAEVREGRLFFVWEDGKPVDPPRDAENPY